MTNFKTYSAPNITITCSPFETNEQFHPGYKRLYSNYLKLVKLSTQYLCGVTVYFNNFKFKLW